MNYSQIVTTDKNNLVNYDHSYSIHELVSIRVRGSENVVKTIGTEFGDSKPDAHSTKNINLNIGMKIDLPNDLTTLGDGMFYSENQDVIITSINKEGVSLKPEKSSWL